MASPRKIVKIIKQREELIDAIPSEFIGQLEKAQNFLAREIINFAKELKTRGGQVQNTPANIQLALRLRDQIRGFLRKGGYFQSVTAFGQQFDELLKVERQYYRAMELSGVLAERDLKTLSNIRKNNINFLMEQDQRVINATYDELLGGIYRERNFRDLARRLERLQTDTTFPNGKTLNGLLKRYSATYAATAYANFDRQINNIKSAEFGIDDFLYSGSLLKDSRPFCVDRVGQTFTKDDVESWQSLSWKGKAEGRDIWTFLGGWNCEHSLSPVTAGFKQEVERLYGKL